MYTFLNKLLEIERRFFLKYSPKDAPAYTKLIYQKYLLDFMRVSCRIRAYGDDRLMTIKIPFTGISKIELEFKIPNVVFSALNLIPGKCLSKQRSFRYIDGMEWTTDIFLSTNHKPIVEVELPNENYKLEIPDWVGEEVTGNPKYYNSNIARRIK